MNKILTLLLIIIIFSCNQKEIIKANLSLKLISMGGFMDLNLNKYKNSKKYLTALGPIRTLKSRIKN